MLTANQVITKAKAIEAIQARSVEHKTLKMYEEFGELCAAYLSYSSSIGSLYKNKTLEDIIEETVDVILCVISVSFNKDITITGDFISLQPSTTKIDVGFFLLQLKDALHNICQQNITYILDMLFHIFIHLQVSDETLTKVFTRKLKKWEDKVTSEKK